MSRQPKNASFSDEISSITIAKVFILVLACHIRVRISFVTCLFIGFPMAQRSPTAVPGGADLSALLREFCGLRLEMKTIKPDMSAMRADTETMGTEKCIQGAEGNQASKGPSMVKKNTKSSTPWFISFVEYNADMERYELRDDEDDTSERIEIDDSVDVKSPPSSVWAVLSQYWYINHKTYGVFAERYMATERMNEVGESNLMIFRAIFMK